MYPLPPPARAQMMELVELAPLRDLLVGVPGGAGLSLEQRSRLSIAVELVANPSLVLMDEPTTGAHTRACHASAAAYWGGVLHACSRLSVMLG